MGMRFPISKRQTELPIGSYEVRLFVATFETRLFYSSLVREVPKSNLSGRTFLPNVTKSPFKTTVRI